MNDQEEVADYMEEHQSSQAVDNGIKAPGALSEITVRK
jgi:hypothetical protein